MQITKVLSQGLTRSTHWLRSVLRTTGVTLVCVFALVAAGLPASAAVIGPGDGGDPVGDCAESMESSLTASPSTVALGHPVRLSWSWSTACGGVATLTGFGVNQTVAHTGSLDVVPPVGSQVWRLTVRVGVFNLTQTVRAFATVTPS